MRNLVFSWLRIPPEPELPAGSHESVRTFRAARNFYYVLLAKWVMKQISVIVGILFALFWIGEWTENLPERIGFWIRLLEWVGLAGVLLQLPFTFYLLKMDYELRWYIVTDRSIRIRAGVWDIREMTMTFANIQHASVSQGPLQRLLGISDVLVRTAGGGSGLEQAGQDHKGAGEMMHIAYFHGVDNAEEIKQLIQERMRSYSDAGLGDPDESHESDPGTVPETVPSELLPAAREFAKETALFRAAMIRPASGH